jgi:hypothetical protein
MQSSINRPVELCRHWQKIPILLEATFERPVNTAKASLAVERCCLLGTDLILIAEYNPGGELQLTAPPTFTSFKLRASRPSENLGSWVLPLRSAQ